MPDVTPLFSLGTTWEPGHRGQHACAVVEAVDPDGAGIDPLAYL